LRTARLQLSYTRIAAPVDGQVSQKSVEPGQYLQPGQALMAIVSIKQAWVVANFKETQIEHMRRGQRADVEVDTYPGHVLRGKIDSIGAATGAKFSLLPPENATGNFVKVVQRIPVKIVLDRPLPRGVSLRPGQNVVATVHL
jgi:membrane fusion protein (multidrug efflux system)